MSAASSFSQAQKQQINRTKIANLKQDDDLQDALADQFGTDQFGSNQFGADQFETDAILFDPNSSAGIGRSDASQNASAAASAAPVTPGMILTSATPTTGTAATTAPATSATASNTTSTTSASTSTAWINALTDVGIKADMVADFAAGSTITYNEITKLLTDVDTSISGKAAGLTSTEFSDLKTIVSDWTSGISMSSYVHDVLNRFVNGDAANAFYTGGATATALGNLKVGSSFTQVNELIGKWFLGTDLPAASVIMSGTSFKVTYKTSTAPLFATGGPSINDINQGYLGDCYLLSSLADVAKNDPSIIKSMIKDNGNGTYGVRFYVNGAEDWVTVNNSLPTYSNSLVFNDAYNNTNDMWVGLVEKAYAQLSASGVVDGNTSAAYGNSFSSIGNGGVIDNVLQEITNASTVTEYWSQSNSISSYTYSTENSSLKATSTSGQSTQTALNSIVAALNASDDVSLCSVTNSYDSSGYQCLVKNHAMSITGFDASTGNLIIRNPWGTFTSGYTQTFRTTFEVSLATLMSAGDIITVDNVAASAPTLALQTGSQIWQAGQVVNFALPTGTFVDPHGQALTLIATQSNGTALPSWLTFNATTGTFTGTVPTGLQAFNVIVTATDTTGLSTSETFQISSAKTPSAPVLANQTAAQTWVQGEAVSFALAANTFTDPQVSAMTYTATLSDGTALPSWLSFNATTQTFSGTVALGTKNLALKITAKDAAGLSTSETFSITTPAPSAPVLAAQTGSQNWSQGVASSFSLAAGTFSDPQSTSLTYTATLATGAALPTWLKFNAATQTFSGTAPANAGTLALKVTATDTFGLAASESFSIVTAAPKGPVLANQTAGQTWTIGNAVNLALASNTFSDTNGMTYQAYQILNPGDVNASSWLRFNQNTMTFTGTVGSNESGTLHLQVVARDSTGATSVDNFDISFKNTTGLKVSAVATPSSSQSTNSFSLLAMSH